MPGKKKGTKEKTPDLNEADWAAVKEDFLVQNLVPGRGAPYTLRMCAKKWQLAYGTVRNKASVEGWGEELRERARAQAVASIKKTQELFVVDEAELRARHAAYARRALQLAHEKLLTLTTATLSQKTMVDLFRVATGNERDALGLSKEITIRAPQDETLPASPEETRRFRRLLLKLTNEALRRAEADETNTIEAEVVHGDL